jgi:hypothetical protein
MIVRYEEPLRLTGNVLVQVHDAQTGLLQWQTRAHNRVPLVGRNLIRDLLVGDLAVTGRPPSHVAVGTGTVAPVDGDTALGNEVHRNVITQKSVSASTVTWKFFVPATAANGFSLSEACIVNSSSTAPVRPILSRVTHTPIAKTASITVTYTWVHTLTETT